MALQSTVQRNLILATILFVLGSFAYWFEYSRKPKQEEAKEQAKRVLNLKDVQVAEIRVLGGATDFVFKCGTLATALCKPGDAGKWDIEKPTKASADESTITSFLSTLNTMSSSDTIDLASETPEKRAQLLKDYKLDAASRAERGAKRIEVQDNQGKVQTLYLGETNPVENAVLALRQSGAGALDESKVYLLPSYAKSYFDYKLSHWRNKKVSAVSSNQVTAFKIVAPNGTSSGTKKDGKWTLGDGLPGDSDAIESLISAITYLSAREFAAEDKNSAEGKKVLAAGTHQETLEITGPTNDRHRYDVYLVKSKDKDGQDKAYVIASDLDPIFDVDRGIKDRLNKKPDELRYRKLLTSADRFSIKRVSYASSTLGAAPLAFVQKGSKWVREGNETAAVETQKLIELLDKLAGNRITEFMPLKSQTAPSDALTVNLEIEIGKPARSLKFWKHKGALYGQSLIPAEPYVYRIDPVVDESLPWKADFFNPNPPEPPKVDPLPNAEKKAP